MKVANKIIIKASHAKESTLDIPKDVIKISKEKNINLIIVNFINTVLEEQKFEEILYEVI